VLTTTEISKIYEENADKVYRYFYFQVSNKEIAEDLTSILFHKFIKNLDKYDSTKSQPATWLFAMARNVLIDHFRNKHFKRQKNEINPETKEGESILEVIPDGNKTPEENVQIDRNKRLLYEQVKKLKAHEQELIFFRYVEELSYEEIALRQNIKVNDVGVKLHRALARLKKLVEKTEIKSKFDL